jgi:hypothetical protein
MLLGNILVILDTEFLYVGFDTQGGDMTTVSEEDPFQIAWTDECLDNFLRGLGHDHRLGFDEVSFSFESGPSYLSKADKTARCVKGPCKLCAFHE